MKYLIPVLMILLSSQAIADAKDEKIRKLFEIQGITETVRIQLEEGRSRARLDSQKMLDQMLGQMNPSKEFQERMNRAADRFIKRLQSDRTAEEIVEVLMHYYAPNFSEEEIDKLIKFYSSEVAKKDTEVSRSVWHQLDDHYKESNEKLRTAAVDDFVHDLQIIAKECSCTKGK